MKKNLLFAIVCVLGLFGSLNAQKTVTLGDGETTYSSSIPYNNSYCYSASQQLYSLNELNIPDPGTAVVDTIAFKSATENLNESYIQVYMKNLNKSSYDKADEWVPVTENDKVFEGYYSTTGLDEWCKIALTTPFTYSGTHLLVCVNVCYYYELSSNEQDQFYTYSPDAQTAYSCTLRSDERIDVTNVTAEMLENASLGAEKNQIKFIYSQSENEIDVNYKSIDLGNIALGNNWNEKEDASVVVTIAAAYDKVKSVTCSDSFFALSEIDYAKVPVQFVVTCNKEEATAGKKEAAITINSENGKVIEVPVTANVYEAVSPDVFELAKEVTFTNGVFTDEPDFATLYDDYLLPNEKLDSYAPDAVYSLKIESDTMVLVEVDGPNAKIALYAKDFGGEKGPKADNAYAGDEKILSTTFSYDFEDAKLDDFTIEDYDEFKDNTWKVEEGSLVSYSYYGWWGEDDTWQYMNEADERVITKEAYTITPNSVFELDVRFMDGNGGGSFDDLIVEVSKDGETFTQIELLENFIDKETVLPYSGWQNKSIDLGAKFTELGLEYGDYKVSFYHKNGGSGFVAVDNFTLTERDRVFVPGDYYLVVAADDAFKVTITYGEIPEDEGNQDEPVAPEVPVAPVVTAEATSDTTIVLTWNAVEGAESYNVYQGTDTVAVATAVKDTTYTVKGLKAETEYAFTVTAVNAAGESAKSAEVKATTLKAEGLEELSAAINIYPNPVGNELRIATEMNVESISVYDIYGRQQAISYQLSAITSIDVAELNSGVYFVKVVTNNGEIVKRFIKN